MGELKEADQRLEKDGNVRRRISSRSQKFAELLGSDRSRTASQGPLQPDMARVWLEHWLRTGAGP